VVDVLVFEFMGLAMLALCVIVLAIPSVRRPPKARASDFCTVKFSTVSASRGTAGGGRLKAGWKNAPRDSVENLEFAARP